MSDQKYDAKKTYVGLFGTCGTTTWRKEFISKFDALGITYFNPQVDDWNEEFAKTEAMHLIRDDIILFPVTKDTYGTGSLAETGFSIMQVLKSMEHNKNMHRKVIIMIEDDLDPKLKEDNPVASKESMRARALVNAHLAEIDNPNVYVVSNFKQMLDLATQLYPAVQQLKHAYSLIEMAQSQTSKIRRNFKVDIAGLGVNTPDYNSSESDMSFSL